jgi:polysaccharide biosynthesis protein PslH
MTKILVICTATPDVVSPYQHGSTIWSFVLLEALVQLGEVTLLTPSLPKGVISKSDALFVQETPPSHKIGKLKRAWKSIFSGLIPAMVSVESEVAIQLLQEKLDNFDVCILLDDYAAIYWQYLPAKLPVVLFRHNIFSYSLKMQAAHASTSQKLIRLYHRFQAIRFDRWTSRKTNILVAQSVEMVNQLTTYTEKLADKPPIVLIPVQVYQSIEYKNKPDISSKTADENYLIGIFIGNFLSGANADAAVWFIDSVLPILHEQIKSQFLFRFIGQAPPENLVKRTANNSNIEFAGYVEDLDRAINDADFGFIPLQAGSGVKVKSLTMFGANLPIVTTSVGVEGIAVENGRHCLVCNTAEEFAQGLSALQDSEKRKSLSMATQEVEILRQSNQELIKSLDRVIDLART